MNEIKYDKLIRDNIPKIIKSANKECEIEFLEYEDHLKYLNSKLQEELDEYYEDESVEELADIVEIIYGILKLKDVDLETFEKIRKDKFDKRGGFEKGIKLKKVFDNEV